MISPALFAPLFAVFAFSSLPHPHYPHVNVVQGASGKQTTLYWFTVDYNDEKVQALPSGRDWHLAFARLTNESALACGDAQLPAGDWKLNARKNQDGEFAELVLVPWVLYTAARNPELGADRAERVSKARSIIEEEGLPAEIAVPIASYEAPHADHLEMSVLQKGYRSAQRLSRVPASGVRFSLLIDFGPLHRRLDLEEVWQESDAAAGEASGRRDR